MKTVSCIARQTLVFSRSLCIRPERDVTPNPSWSVSYCCDCFPHEEPWGRSVKPATECSDVLKAHFHKLLNSNRAVNRKAVGTGGVGKVSSVSPTTLEGFH